MRPWSMLSVLLPNRVATGGMPRAMYCSSFIGHLPRTQSVRGSGLRPTSKVRMSGTSPAADHGSQRTFRPGIATSPPKTTSSMRTRAAARRSGSAISST